MKNNIFLFSHQDDEIAVFKTIKDILNTNERIFIFFLTNGNISDFNDIDLISKREKESKKVLEKIGVKSENITFLGKSLGINSYNLLNNLENVYNKLSNFIEQLEDEIKIFTHAWEGGNIDHDSSFVLALKLMRNYSNIKYGYQFPYYNSYKMPFNFYRIFYPISINGHAVKSRISFNEKIEFIKYLFYYISQVKIWMGLYPFVIIKILTNNYNYLQEIKNNFELKKPHQNLLWYEKRKFVSFEKSIILFKTFLNSNI